MRGSRSLTLKLQNEALALVEDVLTKSQLSIDGTVLIAKTKLFPLSWQKKGVTSVAMVTIYKDTNSCRKA